MRRKMKKVLAAGVALTMAASLLSGCKKADNENVSENAAKSTKAETEAGEAAGTSARTDEGADIGTEDTYEIVMSYVTLGSEPQDLGLVEKALSDLTKEKINCTVKFKPVSMVDLASQYNLWASSGEKVDLMMMFNMDLGTYINEGKILQLDEYVDKAPAISAVNEERNLFKGGLYNDKLYAIPVANPSLGEGKAFYVRKDILDAVGYEEKDIYTYEDLDKIFENIKAKYPDLTTCAWAGVQSNTLSYEFIPYDTLGVAGGWAGVVMNPMSGEKKVTNLYETDEYYEYLQWVQKWQQAGYISKDAATTSDQPADWVKAGRSAGFLLGDDTPGNKDNNKATTGYDIVQMNIKPTYLTTTTYSQLRWCIGANSEQPEKVMQFLDMWYDGPEAVNLLMNGVEGNHYVKNGESMIISYPEGINGTNTPYNNVLGIYGDKRNMYMFEPNKESFYAESDAYTENALKYPSLALGYTFNSDDFQTEMAAISSVISQYVTTLEYGMATDLEATYQEFIAALDNAGMNKLVEENQKQLDTWLANQK